jgi:hypothetical protein
LRFSQSTFNSATKPAPSSAKRFLICLQTGGHIWSLIVNYCRNP